MSAITLTSFSTWNKGTNPVAKAFRESLFSDKISRLDLVIWGIAKNVFATLGHFFAGIAHQTMSLIRLRSSDNKHWTLMKVHAAFTWMCIQAIGDVKNVASQWWLIAAKSCLDESLNKQLDPAKRTKVHVDCLAGELTYDELRSELTRLYNKFSDHNKKEFLLYLKGIIFSTPALSDEFQLFILKFLEPLRTDKEIESIINRLLTENMEKQQRVFIVAEDGEAQFLPKTFVEKELNAFFHSGDFAPSLQTAKAQNYSDGLKLQPEYDYQFINNLRLINTIEKTLWKAETKHLYENLSFLRQLASRQHPEAGNVYQEYLAFACKDLVSKLFKDEILNEDQFTKLLELIQIVNDKELTTVTFLYFFRHYPVTFHPSIHASINQNMKAIIALLFQNKEENKIHFVPTFVRLLTFNLQNNDTERVISLCDQAGQCHARFTNVPQDDLNAVRNEFAEVWSKFSPAEHLDVCLAIYKCLPVDKSNLTHPTILPSTLDAQIFNVAHIAATSDKSKMEASDEILSLAIERLSIESLEDALNLESIKLIFKHLVIANTKGYEKLKNSCVKRILAGMTVHEGVSFISGIPSEEELAAFIKSLQSYSGPQKQPSDADAKYALKTEALSLLRFAKIQKQKGNNDYYDSCVRYLRSKPQYRVAAEAYTGLAPEETELYSLCSTDP